jgi:nicotinate dehydrogenase subunit A
VIDLNVNGHTHTVDADPETPLLYVLRDDLQLNAAKFGCGLGQCGACTVLVDGAPALSCITPILLLAGRQITTLEGLGTLAHPGPMQQAFIEEQAAQCGFCIPGMMMRAQALLQRNPHASESDIRTQLEPNLCRCGTHMRILRAVQRAAELMKSGAAPQTLADPLGQGSTSATSQPSANPDTDQPSTATGSPDHLRRPAHSEQRERPER